MTTRQIQDSLPIHHPATTPTVFTGFDSPCLVQPVDAPSRAILVSNGVPILLNSASPAAVITSVAADGLLLRRDGVTAIFTKVDATHGRLRFATYQMTTAGIALAQGIVRVGVRGANLATTTGPLAIVYAKGSGELAMSDIITGVGAGAGVLATGTAGDLGLFDATIEFGGATGVKTITLEYGGDQYIVSVDIT